MIIAKVLLTEVVESLGYVGQVVEVADGYARNYLFPKRLAVVPTEHNIELYARQRAEHEALLQEREEQAIAVRDLLADRTFVFTRKAHDDDKLYGSVRAEDIAARIAEETGRTVEAARIRSEQPIETLGAHAVTIGLYKDISVDVRIRVDEEGVKEE